MVAAFMFGMITLVFYVIYESVLAEDKERKEKNQGQKGETPFPTYRNSPEKRIRLFQKTLP